MKYDAKIPDARSSRDLESIAAHWVMRQHAGLQPSEQMDLERWLATDPRHWAAFSERCEAWRLLQGPRLGGSGRMVRLALEKRRHRRRVRIASFAAGIAIAIACVVTLVPIPRWFDLGPKTVLIHPNAQLLPDGSKVELNASASILVEFTDQERIVRLQHGEALFDVAKNKQRPFIVKVGKVNVRAVGTEFSVRNRAEQVDVFVTEGTVQVRPADSSGAHHLAQPAVQSLGSSPNGGAAIAYVTAGQHATVPLLPDGEIQAVRVVSIPQDAMSQELGWRAKRVEFTETPLSEAVQIINQQNRLKIIIADPSLNERCITGICWSNDPEAFVRLIESGFDCRSMRQGEQIIVGARD